MNGIQEILGGGFIIIGVIFSLLGVVGVLRLPDTYTRLHASGKTATIGILFLGIGTGIIRPEWAFKVLALSIFLIFSSPVASHAIASAVHRSERFEGHEEAKIEGEAHEEVEAVEQHQERSDDQRATGTSPA